MFARNLKFGVAFALSGLLLAGEQNCFAADCSEPPVKKACTTSSASKGSNDGPGTPTTCTSGADSAAGGTAANEATANACLKAAQACFNACNEKAQATQDPGLKQQYLQIGQQCNQDSSTYVPPLKAQAGQMTGVTAGGKDCTQASNLPQIPPISPPQSGGDNSSPSPTPTPSPSAIASACDSSTSSSCSSATTSSATIASLNDSGSSAAFVTPQKSMQTASADSGTLTLGSSGTSAAGMGAASTGGGVSGGGGSSGSSSSNSMGTASTNDRKDPRASGVEGSVSGMAPNNEYGSEGGGSGMGTASEDSAASLAAYLPGGKKDPTKRDPAKAGGMNTASAHPDIVSQNESLFNMISKRMHLMCDLKEFIGCN